MQARCNPTKAIVPAAVTVRSIAKLVWSRRPSISVLRQPAPNELPLIHASIARKAYPRARHQEISCFASRRGRRPRCDRFCKKRQAETPSTSSKVDFRCPESHKRLCYDRYCGAERGVVPPMGGVASDGTGPGTEVPVELNAAGAGAGTADCRSSGTGAGAPPFAGSAADGNGCGSADSIGGNGAAVEALGRGLARSTSEGNNARAVVGAFSAPNTAIVVVPPSVFTTKL